MSCLTQIFRRSQSCFEVRDGLRRISLVKRLPSHHEISPRPLAEHQPFAPLPRLEFACSQQVERLIRLSCLVVERCQLHGKIIAFIHEIRMTLEFTEASFRRFSNAFPELVSFIEHPGIVWVRREGAGKCISRLVFLVANVEVCECQVAPYSCKTAVETGGKLPEFDRLHISFPVVEEISKVVRCACIRGICRDRRLKNLYLFDKVREAIPRMRLCGFSVRGGA